MSTEIQSKINKIANETEFEGISHTEVAEVLSLINTDKASKKEISSISAGFQFSINPSTPIPAGGWLPGIYPVEISGTYPNQDNIIVDLNDGYVGLVFDGENWSKMVLPLDSQLAGKTEELRNFQIAKNFDDYENAELISFDSGNKYIDFEGNEHILNGCVITDLIDCRGMSHIIPYSIISDSGYNIFYDTNNNVAGRFQVTADKIGEPVPIPKGVTYIKLCSFIREIEKPVALLVGSRKNEILQIGFTAFAPKIKSFNTWAQVYSSFIKITFPSINYSLGCEFNFSFTLTDIPNINSGKEDSTIKIRGNLLVVNDSYKHWLQKEFGNKDKISSIKIMKDNNSIPCIILTRPPNASVYKIDVNSFSAFSNQINNGNKSLFLDYSIENVSGLSGYSEIYDYTSDIYIENNGDSEKHPFDGKKIRLVGDSITHGYDATFPGNQSPYYIDFIKEKLKTEQVYRYGTSGGTIATGSAENHILRDGVLNFLVSDNPDLIILMGGINDYQNNTPIGDISSDRTTTVGSLRYAIEFLLSRLPNATLLFCSSGGYYYTMSGVLQSGRNPNAIGKNARDYFQSCIDLCKQYAIPVVDFNAECGWLDSNEVAGKYKWTTDGLHFSAKAYDKLTTMQFNKLKQLF